MTFPAGRLRLGAPAYTCNHCGRLSYSGACITLETGETYHPTCYDQAAAEVDQKDQEEKDARSLVARRRALILSWGTLAILLGGCLGGLVGIGLALVPTRTKR